MRVQGCAVVPKSGIANCDIPGYFSRETWIIFFAGMLATGQLG